MALQNNTAIGWMATPGENVVQRKAHGAQDGRLIDRAKVAGACSDLASPDSGLMPGATIDFDQTVVGLGLDARLPLPA